MTLYRKYRTRSGWKRAIDVLRDWLRVRHTA